MRKKESKSSNFIVQGGILAVAGIISRIIGLLYRIPLQKTIGDSGMG
jgi:stage V sporulation protein B